MTLLDAPTYDPSKARRRKNILIASLITLLVLAGLLLYFWNWPQEHRVNQFLPPSKPRTCPKPSPSGTTIRIGSSTRNNMLNIPMAASKSIGATPATGATSRHTKS